MKKTKLTRSLMAACSIVALTAVMYGCVHNGGDDPAEPMVEPMEPMEPMEPVPVAASGDITLIDEQSDALLAGAAGKRRLRRAECRLPTA